VLEKYKLFDKEEAINLLKISDIDPASTIAKMRSIIERIVKFLFSRDFPGEPAASLELAIKKLRDCGTIPNAIGIFLTTLRISGNVAVHDRIDSKDDVSALIPLFIRTVEWFVNEHLSKVPASEVKPDLSRFKDAILDKEEAIALHELEEFIREPIVIVSSSKFHSNREAREERPHIWIENAHIIGLELRGLRLKEIPSPVKIFKQLRYLNLELNRITSVPDWFIMMDSLDEVVVDPKLVKIIRNFMAQNTKRAPTLHARLKSALALSQQILSCSICFALFFLLCIGLSVSGSIPDSTTEQVMVFFSHLTFYEAVHFIAILLFNIPWTYQWFLKRRYKNRPVEKLAVDTANAIMDLKKQGSAYYIIRDGKLVDLQITGAKFTTIPDIVRSFKDIKRLNLSHNLILSVPTWIAELSSLELLELQKNPFRTIPSEILNLSRLKFIHLPLPPRRDPRLKDLRRQKVRVKFISRFYFLLILHITLFILSFIASNQDFGSFIPWSIASALIVMGTAASIELAKVRRNVELIRI